MDNHEALIRLAMDQGYDTIVILAKKPVDPRPGILVPSLSQREPESEEEGTGLSQSELAKMLREHLKTDEDETPDASAWVDAVTHKPIKPNSPQPQ